MKGTDIAQSHSSFKPQVRQDQVRLLHWNELFWNSLFKEKCLKNNEVEMGLFELSGVQNEMYRRHDILWHLCKTNACRIDTGIGAQTTLGTINSGQLQLGLQVMHSHLDNLFFSLIVSFPNLQFFCRGFHIISLPAPENQRYIKRLQPPLPIPLCCCR